MKRREYQRDSDEAVVIMFGFIAAIMALVVIAAMIAAPLSGNWTPDVAVAICAAVAGIVWLWHRWLTR